MAVRRETSGRSGWSGRILHAMFQVDSPENLDPAGDFAAVVLLSGALGPKGNHADVLGRHERFSRRPAVSFAHLRWVV